MDVVVFIDITKLLTLTRNGATLAEQYTRDNLGRITQKTGTINGVTTTYNYTYDPAGRLTEVKQNGLTTATYTYDANSNRLTGPVGAIASTYDAQERLLTAGSTTYTCTANGKLLTKTIRRTISCVPSFSPSILRRFLKVMLL